MTTALSLGTFTTTVSTSSTGFVHVCASAYAGAVAAGDGGVSANSAGASMAYQND
jgi:hypothetical protein